MRTRMTILVAAVLVTACDIQKRDRTGQGYNDEQQQQQQQRRVRG